MRYSIERIEEKIALCEDDDGNVIRIKTKDLPTGAREGDIIEQTENGLNVNADETERRRKKMAELQKGLFGQKKR